MLYDLKEGSVRLGGAETNWISFGKGTRDLVMIPGLVLGLKGLRGSGASLALSYRLFAKDRRVWFFDHPDPLPEHVTVKELADDLAAAMRAVGVERAEVLGVSQGGMIAQYLALDHPEAVSALVLAVTLCRNNPVAEDCIRRWSERARAGEMGALMRGVMESMYSEAYIRRYRFLFPLLGASVRSADPQRFLTLAEACLSCDTAGRLGGIRCPTLVVGGERDRVVTAAASRELAAGIGCALHMYPDYGHAAYDEAKDFNRLVYHFFKSHGEDKTT